MNSPGSDNTDADHDDCQCEPERAIERLGNMRALYANVVARFVDDSAGNFAKLRQAVESGDLKAMHQTAHSLKGLAAMCGAVGVESILCELESAAVSEDAAEVPALYHRLGRAMTETRGKLAAYRQPAAERVNS